MKSISRFTLENDCSLVGFITIKHKAIEVSKSNRIGPVCDYYAVDLGDYHVNAPVLINVLACVSNRGSNWVVNTFNDEFFEIKITKIDLLNSIKNLARNYIVNAP